MYQILSELVVFVENTTKHFGMCFFRFTVYVYVYAEVSSEVAVGAE